MTAEEKKIIENNFDRMREVIRETKLFINVGNTTVGETYLRDGDVFRIATALINEGFRLEPIGEWLQTENYYAYRCSRCGEITRQPNDNYCSNCGAKMTEERYE